jgi:hypothetical protein
MKEPSNQGASAWAATGGRRLGASSAMGALPSRCGTSGDAWRPRTTSVEDAEETLEGRPERHSEEDGLKSGGMSFSAAVE